MKSSLILLSGAASIALASPLVPRDVDVVVEVVTATTVVDVHYTVTEEVVAPATPTPTTTSAPAPVIVTVTVPASSSTTKEAPKVAVAADSVVSDISSVVVVAATTTSSTAASSSPTDFEGIAVYHHNIHRANSSAPDVTYNSTAAGYAATLAARCTFEHDV